MPHGKISDDNIRVTVIVPKDIKSKAIQAANLDNRSLSSWIRKLIIDAVSNNE